MTKKSLLVFLLVTLIVGGVFAQTDFESMPKNTISVDLGPTIIGLAIGQLGSIIGDDSADTSGFGIAVQYERQIMQKLTLSAKIGYLAGGVGMTQTDSDNGVALEAKMGLDISSLNLEAHARYYPFGGTFFLDGMLGYANLTTKISGKVIVHDDYTNRPNVEGISMDAKRDFFNLGAKIGWRVDFGNPGGFIFETSFGYYYDVGLGDTIGKQLTKKMGNVSGMSEIDDAFKILEDVVFVGGPRLTLSFGYRF